MRPSLHNLAASGAIDGQVAAYDASLDEWVPIDPPPPPPPRLLVLTTSINGVPDLVWDHADHLVYTEVES